VLSLYKSTKKNGELFYIVLEELKRTMVSVEVARKGERTFEEQKIRPDPKECFWQRSVYVLVAWFKHLVIIIESQVS